MKMGSGKLKVKLTGSYIGCKEPQKRTLRALGLRKRDDERVHDATPVILGMIDAVKHVVTVESAE
jgi:large subunit ribosomal protein L30